MISRQGLLVRNAALAIVNGAITLVILLIAPLGIAAVMINTLLVAIATYVTATMSDRILFYLSGKSANPELRSGRASEIAQRQSSEDITRF